jgi:hypothetical protein
MSKTQHNCAVIALAACAAMGTINANAATYAAGDLLMGFVAGGGQGSNQTLVVNLGSASSFRNNFDTGTTQLNFKSIGTQLGAQFGNSWYDRTDLYISLFASTASDPIGDTLAFGDPFRTIYASRSRLTPSSSATAFSIASNTAITTTSSQMVAASGTYSTAAADAFGVAIIPDAANTLDNYTKPAASNSFTNLSGGIEQAFAAGSWGTMGPAGAVEAALDLQRLQAVNNITGQYGFGETLRRGDYTGTFTINQAGSVSFVPEPTAQTILGLTLVAALLRRRRA